MYFDRDAAFKAVYDFIAAAKEPAGAAQRLAQSWELRGDHPESPLDQAMAHELESMRELFVIAADPDSRAVGDLVAQVTRISEVFRAIDEDSPIVPRTIGSG